MNIQILSNPTADYLTEKVLKEKIKIACSKIAPVWPLDSFVAVNPYLGLAGHSFETAADLLHKVGNIQMCMPLAFYQQALEQGKMHPSDVETSLKKSTHFRELGFEAFMQQLEHTNAENASSEQLHSFAEVATAHCGLNWSGLMVNRIAEWAAAYFDEGQAIWKSASNKDGLYNSWRKEARLDLTPGIMGLKGFQKYVGALPDEPLEATRLALARLAIPEAGLDHYLHSLLLRLGGWAAYAAQIDWESELYGGSDGTLSELLAVLLGWETGLLSCLEKDTALIRSWNYASRAFAKFQPGTSPGTLLQQRLLLQQAFDLAEQRRIVHKLNSAQQHCKPKPSQARVQAIFCIDVRSEVFRRNLESISPEIETLGFAGFFAFPIRYIPTAHAQGQAQCPVLLPTGPIIHEKMTDETEQANAEKSRSLQRQVEHAWKSFKLGAISCFSFVGPIGLAYLPKLLTDSFGLSRPVPHPDKKGLNAKQLLNRDISLEPTENDPDSGIPLKERISMAESALHAMTLTEHFARLVLIVGHGASTVNNPHASGLDCGACGGHTGEANARVAAAVLNDTEVRKALKNKGIDIPESTVFLACQHDTTTDEVSIFNEDRIPLSHIDDVAILKKQLEKTGQATRAERAMRLQLEKKDNHDQDIFSRSRDWAQVRPEWGLAGCSAFIVAPRTHSQSVDLQGRSFLHSYAWQKDKDFAVLELIMTAPMVVTSWISLQYYASSVDNLHHGSGNKTLHNVTGNIGVLEGNSGDLRVGLPWQSVHDGEKLQHDPVRLNVCIQAPREAMNNILAKHASVKQLCDNGWIHLLAMNDAGMVTHRYDGSLQWEALDKENG